MADQKPPLEVSVKLTGEKIDWEQNIEMTTPGQENRFLLKKHDCSLNMWKPT